MPSRVRYGSSWRRYQWQSAQRVGVLLMTPPWWQAEHASARWRPSRGKAVDLWKECPRHGPPRCGRMACLALRAELAEVLVLVARRTRRAEALQAHGGARTGRERAGLGLVALPALVHAFEGRVGLRQRAGRYQLLDLSVSRSRRAADCRRDQHGDPDCPRHRPSRPRNLDTAMQNRREGRRAQGETPPGSRCVRRTTMAAWAVVTNAKADVDTGGIVSVVVHVKLLLSPQFTRQSALALKFQSFPAQARPRRRSVQNR